MPAERFDFPNASGERLAALLDRPVGAPRAFALFAHCFTCGKDIRAAKRIAEGLTARGIAVLRFDFTGIGASEGEFANTNFSSNVADLVPDRVVGLHLNFVVVPRPPDGTEPTPEEAAALAALAAWRRDGAAYQEIQGTRPQTLGYALEDSPAGLCAWIVEKFRAWSGGDDGLRAFRADRLLDNVTLYWVTRTATSSTRLYWEMRQAGRAALPERRVEVPTGVACYPDEVSRFPRSWVETRYRVTHWVEQPRGGHFAAMQEPGLFVDDVRAFFATLG